MSEDRTAILVGAGAGALAFGAFLGFWIRANMGGIESRSSAFGETVAQAAVQQYMADRVGLTTERLQQIRTLVGVLHPNRG